jgi:hypothetical protein
MGNVDPLTVPEAVGKPGGVAEEKGERRIDLAEIVGLPDFDVSVHPHPKCID